MAPCTMFRNTQLNPLERSYGQLLLEDHYDYLLQLNRSQRTYSSYSVGEVPVGRYSSVAPRVTYMENVNSSVQVHKGESKICGVCGDKALGYNFNAVTCESCKAFFRRNALKNKEFQCLFNNNCEINTVTRRFCQKCRLKKCFTIGMKKEWIMSEEDKKKKKKKIEENRAKRQQDRSSRDDSKEYDEDEPKNSHLTGLPESGEDESVAAKVPRLKDQVDIHNSQDLVSAGNPHTLPTAVVAEDSLSSSSPQCNKPTVSINFTANVPSSAGTSSDAAAAKPNVFSANSHIAVSVITSSASRIESQPGILTSVSNNSSPLNKTVAEPSMLRTILKPATQLSSSSKVVDSNTNIGNMPLLSSLINPNTSPCASPEASSVILQASPAPLQNSEPEWGFFKEGIDDPRSSLDEPIPLDVREKVHNIRRRIPVAPDSIESILSEAIKIEFEAYSSLAGSQSSSRELNDAERAKLNELIVANKALLTPLDDDLTALVGEECRFKTSTGDCPVLLDVINLTAIAIRRLIKMFKKINAFKNMCQEDQVALMKGGCTELMLLRSVMTYDPDRDSWKIPHSQEQMNHIKVAVLKEARGNIYQEHQRFLQTFDPRWRADENIMLILSAITLFTPDRPHVVHHDVIKFEQNSYYYLLRRYLESVYPGCEARSAFLKLIQKMAELHKLNEDHVKVYLDVNPRDVEPLLIEIFDLKPH